MRLLNKNIVKKSLVVLLVFICYIFASCSNSLDSTPSATGRYSVTGKISFADSSGAAPLILTKDSEGRTATTSFNNAHFSLNLYAYKYGQNGLDRSKKYDNVVVDQSGSFFFCFESKGEYVIYAELIKDEKTCGKGSAYVDVNSFTPKSVRINASPVITEDGKIQLAVSAATDTDPQIKKVCVSWIYSYNYNIEDEANQDGTGHESSPAMQIMNSVLTEGEYNKSFDVVNGTATISYDDFPGGSWLAKICFDDENGNTLYSCQEIINVYPTFTTNIWYGSSPALTDGTFKITTNMVTNYDAECYPNTNYVLYNNTGSDYQYYLKDSPSASVSGTADVSASLNSFCFDADGNFYSLDFDLSTYEYTIYKNNEQLATLEDSNDYRLNIIVDLATNILYTWAINGYSLLITKYSNLISDGSMTETTEYRINGPSIRVDDDTNTTIGPDICTIYNGIVYVIECDNSDFEMGSYFCGVPLESATYELTETECVNLLLEEKGLGNALSQDMIYQDGSVYILYKESDTYKSRGALIKYDTTTDDINVIGYSDAVKENSELADVMLQAYDREYDNDNNLLHYQLFTDAACSIPLYVPANTSFIDSEGGGQLIIYGCFESALYTPAPLAESLSEDAFYGPVKFIAIKPKKLVIADDGIAFYTDSEGVLKYKNVNRVVTVDLDTFSLEIQSSGVSFDSDSTDKKTFFSTSADTGYSNALEAYISTTTPAYYDTGVQLTSRSNTYLAIPCGD